jgi:hypothetical protein
MRITKKIIALLFLSLLFIGNISAQITAEQLAEEYENNEVRADRKYKNKRFIVSGTIYNVEKRENFAGKETLIVRLEKRFFFSTHVGVSCEFSEDEEFEISELKKGQSIEITGTCVGIDYSYPTLKSCSIHKTPQQIDAEREAKERAEKQRLEAERKAEERRKELERLAEERRKEAERLAEEKRRKEYTDAFLKERETKKYHFSDEAQQSNLTAIEDAVKSVLDNIGTNLVLSSVSITDKVFVDYNGINSHAVVVDGLDSPEIEQELINAITLLNFVPETATESYTGQQYPVNVEGIFTCNVSSQNYENVTAKKRHQGIIVDGNVPPDVQDAASTLMPLGGDYVLNLNRTTINGKNTYDNSVVTKYHNTGGASNAWLSLLVPGLGDSRVTYGKDSGVGTALLVYGLIGTGIGLKFHSNSEYEKYHAATEQTVIDKHYKSANHSNQAFYACVGAGALIWIWDIIDVATTGAKNTKAAKAYKQSHFGVYHQPDFNASGLTYTINF